MNHWKYNLELMEAIETVLMVDAAELTFGSALFRKESRGHHNRTDFPDTDDKNWRCHTIASWTGQKPPTARGMSSIQGSSRKKINNWKTKFLEVIMATSAINAKIYRFDPDKDKEAYYQDYNVPIDRSVTIHELLSIIRRDIDSTLAFRTYKCYKGMCQTCLVKLNGKPVKSCATQVGPDEKITLEPASGGNVVRDLVVDFKGM
jgi:hypothetical protein